MIRETWFSLPQGQFDLKQRTLVPDILYTRWTDRIAGSTDANTMVAITTGAGDGTVRHGPNHHGGGMMDTYNLYMDEIPADDGDDAETVDVEFRVVPASEDTSDDDNTPVVAGLDLVDLINLRDALSQEIDNYALTALEAEATAALGAEE